MYVVENTSDETQHFYEVDPAGGFRLVSLPAGERGTFDIDPLHGRFHRGGLKATPAPKHNSRPKAKRPKA